MIEVKTYPCITVQQPIGTFYIASISARDLRKMCWADIRSIERGERDVEVISGIQRPLSDKRQKEIAKYVRTVDASFPTAIIVAIDPENALYDEETKTITLNVEEKTAKVLDGQHRLEGLREFSEHVFELNTTIFIGIETQEQAVIFSTINLTQTKVSKSLVYDLYEYADSRSPQKTSHNVARVAHVREDSPFHGRIKILGTALNKDKELITQAGFVEPIIKMISTDPLEDLDQMKRADRVILGMGKGISLPKAEEIRAKNLVFRLMFLQNRDDEIARTIFNYFTAVARRWPEAWNTTDPGIVLPRTTGYRAMMGFLPFVLFRLGLDKVHSIDTFFSIFNAVRGLTDGELNTNNFKPGSSGEAALRQRLLNSTGITDREAWRGRTAQSK